MGLVACNDYIILESCIYRILKKHFAGKSYYPLLLDFFHEVGCPYELVFQHLSPVHHLIYQAYTVYEREKQHVTAWPLLAINTELHMATTFAPITTT